MITLGLVDGLVTNNWEDKVLVVVWEQGLMDSITALRNLPPYRTSIRQIKMAKDFQDTKWKTLT